MNGFCLGKLREEGRHRHAPGATLQRDSAALYHTTRKRELSRSIRLILEGDSSFSLSFFISLSIVFISLPDRRLPSDRVRWRNNPLPTTNNIDGGRNNTNNQGIEIDSSLPRLISWFLVLYNVIKWKPRYFTITRNLGIMWHLKHIHVT